MWTANEWRAASYRSLTARSAALKDIDRTVEAYDSVKSQHPDDLVLRIYTLSLVIASIDRWFEQAGDMSKRRTAVITLYNTAKLERNQLRTRFNAEAAAKAEEEQKKLIASIQGTLSQMLKPPPPAPPKQPQVQTPMTPQQKQETDEAITNARKQILATTVGQHLLSELTKRRLMLIGVSDDTSKLDKIDRQAVIDDLPKIQLGYLTSKSILNVDNVFADRKETARAEGIRILTYMLGNSKEVAAAFFEKGFQVVVVPKDKLMTEVAEFSALHGRTTFDGRNWDTTRGAGYVFETPDGSAPSDLVDYMNQEKKIFVAVTEENLVGERTTLQGQERTYTCGYSTTLHEFAHTIDKFALKAEQRDVIQRLYKTKRSDGAGKELTLSTQGGQLYIFFDGDMAQIPAILNRAWADGPRMGAAGSAAQYPVYTFANAFRGNVTLPTKPIDCYAASHRMEYFAQTACAYFGSNTGNDPTTRHPRNNGRSWVEANEPAEFLQLFDDLFGRGRYLLDDLNLRDMDKGARWWEK